MGSITVRDVDESNLEDVFRVCSHGKLDDPLQQKGIELRRSWLRRILRDNVSCSKIAYLDSAPVAQLLFYPEESAPFIPQPRRGVVLLRCVYNPFKEAQGKGASTALVKNLIEECRGDPPYLKGVRCRFIASEAFNTGEGTPMEKFYASNGFEKKNGEMALLINGTYTPTSKLDYHPNESDRGKAIALYNPTCEYSYPFATRVRDLLNSIYPKLTVKLINQWEDPAESIRLGNHWLTVNGTPIVSSWNEKESLIKEIKQAVEKGAER
jgi:hypothetical protein